MPGHSGKIRHTKNRQTPGRRVPFYLWFFYLGLLCLSLTGVTFSRYFTTVTGTISVQVADSSVVTFMDSDGATVLSETRVYEGQKITNTPDMSGSEATLYSDTLNMDTGDHIYSDEDIVYRVFKGWSLDGVNAINLDQLEVTQDTVLIAVYQILPEPVVTASPSNATPSDATPSNAAFADTASAGADVSGAGQSETAGSAVSNEKPQTASPSNMS